MEARVKKFCGRFEGFGGEFRGYNLIDYGLVEMDLRIGHLNYKLGVVKEVNWCHSEVGWRCCQGV